ncbi:hypothetical protein KJ365_09465 [Glaciecola sp. XM2]|uniref:hypothetical protein n=1 Tax=Glaciecola sp. XM2 TaxID=1914931 RepID=UPI001BDF3354|nr:hypothetical protein [Glaciecola sp. XM2]MBT1451107.1 hypothetical protein [Glaciecola sp. XM2]
MIKIKNLSVVESKAHYYAPLLSWFTDEVEFMHWAGPHIPFRQTMPELASLI